MDDTARDAPPPDDGLAPELIDAFIARWSAATGTERANYQLFLTELCSLLGLPQPDPARGDTQENAYCFEHRVIFQHGDGTQSQGFIDLYRRACYVLECKQTGLTLDTGGWDKAMLRAHGQAVQYVRALPPPEGRPPFVVVVDVGRSIELYSEFSRSGGADVCFSLSWRTGDDFGLSAPQPLDAFQEAAGPILVRSTGDRLILENQSRVRLIRNEAGTECIQKPTPVLRRWMQTNRKNIEVSVPVGPSAFTAATRSAPCSLSFDNPHFSGVGEPPPTCFLCSHWALQFLALHLHLYANITDRIR
ncbi:hypothetical protein THSYN_21000 [Candidatus Thiodictyon syntrophicum]|jgi:hypothetical protein|uniref:MmeI-like N-terminal domain-containing protein n=1 Tax=Candidatus Thiodictyon syntrophicum TaxID=1166950 RepID=A0A2K8UC51_9GAMM|nr:hypothetical protein THSYN_21000 [Candidatus Thiodictyon syntrophicum]